MAISDLWGFKGFGFRALRVKGLGFMVCEVL